jgi:hypothetical protein
MSQLTTETEYEDIGDDLQRALLQPQDSGDKELQMSWQGNICACSLSNAYTSFTYERCEIHTVFISRCGAAFSWELRNR